MATQVPDDATTRTVHIGNLDFNVPEELLKSFFEMHCGPVVRTNLVGQPDGTQVVRYGFVEFASADSVPKAFVLSGAVLGLYPIKVSQARGQILKSANHTFMPAVDPAVLASNTHAYASGLQAENLRYQQWLAARAKGSGGGADSDDSAERRRKRRRRRGRSSSSSESDAKRRKKRGHSRSRSRSRNRDKRRSREREKGRDRRDKGRDRGRDKDHSKERDGSKERDTEPPKIADRHTSAPDNSSRSHSKEREKVVDKAPQRSRSR
eukprot:GGOE01061282.1.p1 GENE.GGOE01061282.1~~GGOE01061282.1.p1  ORF type:complete len:265 (-),score=50.30 GGOE01061282.1:150-944(-)